MFDNLSTNTGHRLAHQNFMRRTIRPWDMFFNVMTRQNTHALLSALDDHLLKDIGVSRGAISFIHTITQRTPSIHQQPTSNKGKLP